MLKVIHGRRVRWDSRWAVSCMRTMQRVRGKRRRNLGVNLSLDGTHSSKNADFGGKFCVESPCIKGLFYPLLAIPFIMALPLTLISENIVIGIGMDSCLIYRHFQKMSRRWLAAFWWYTLLARHMRSAREHLFRWWFFAPFRVFPSFLPLRCCKVIGAWNS